MYAYKHCFVYLKDFPSREPYPKGSSYACVFKEDGTPH